MNKGIKIIFKFFLWLIIGIISLILMVFLLIQMPAFQDIARKKAVSYLQDKLKTKVEVNKISIGLSGNIVLEGVYFEDQNRDTLLAGDAIGVDISLLKLLNNNLHINEINLQGITVNIKRTMPDSIFNFDYILDAFSSPKDTIVDTTAGMKISMDRINLKKIRVTFKDAVTANDISFHFDDFETNFREFDLDKMKFSIPDIKLTGLYANIVQGKPALKQESAAKIEPDSNEPLDLDLKLGIIDLSKIKIKYQNDISNLKTNLNLGQLLVNVESTNLKGQRIALKKIKLANTSVAVILGKTEQEKVVPEDVGKVAVETLNNNWRVTVGNIDFSAIDLKFDDFNQPVQNKGMDYAHLGLSGINLQAETFLYSNDTIYGHIAKTSLKNKDGFELSALKTNFIYCNKGAILKDLYLETPGTTIRDYIRIDYPSLEALANDPGKVNIKVNFEKSKISFKDILTFAPQLAAVDPFKNNPDAILNIAGNINGSLSDLDISDLMISGFESTLIDVSGSIKGLPDMNRAIFDVNISEFTSGRADLNQLFSSGMIPETINLPDYFSFSGKFLGGLSNFETNLDMTSSYGDATVSAGVQNGDKKGQEAFNATIELFDFNAGHLLMQDSVLGNVSARAEVKGIGIDPKTMNAQLSVIAGSAEVKGYIYKNLILEGNIVDQNIALIAKMDDQNIQFDIDAKTNIATQYPSVNFTLNLDTLNLQKLNLYDSDLRLRGKIVAVLPSTNPDSLIGTISVSNFLVTANGNPYLLDSISVTASTDSAKKTLNIQSEIITATLTGHYNLTEIGDALTHEIDKYFKIGDSLEMKAIKAQDFNFALNITNHPIVQEFVPLLSQLEPVVVKGSFNSEAGGLKMEASTPKIVYSGTAVDNVKLIINSDESALNYSLNLDKISTASLNLNKTSLNGQALDNRVSVNLNIKDQSEKNKYQLAGLFAVIDGQYQFRFNKDSLMLNYDPWSVAAENLLQFGSKGIMAANLKLSSNSQTLSVNSNPQQLNAPLIVDFTKFKISTLTAFDETDTLLADGVINGKVELSNLESSPVFVSDLTINDFSFKADTLGDISLKVNNSVANTYAAEIKITGKGNDIALEGEYLIRPENKSSFDFDLDIKKLNLSTMEGFTMGSLKNTSGNIFGKLKITGTADAPTIRGDLSFNKAEFNIAMLNSYYTIADEKVSFTSEGISFNTFTLVDSAGNKAVIDGSVFTTNYTDYRFGLDFATTDFKVLNSTKKENNLFWGTVFINSDMRIRGDMKSPVVEGNVKINKGTYFSVVIPQSDPGIVDREGVVTFVDMRIPESGADLGSGLDSLNISDLTGMDISVNVAIDSNAVFNIIIDEANGDFLEVQGDASLTAGIDQTGKVNLTGVFEVTKGAYELSFNFMKKRFVIQKGSVISWQGEPTTADVNVSAVYVAKASPYNLVASQLNEPPETLNRYKQKLPFEVTLNMKGDLMKPLITFDINLPNRSYSVTRDVVDNVQYQLIRLKTQPSELNKQVFALLLLNQFVAEDPFANVAGSSGAVSLARTSASKLLSEQLNQLAGNLIKGVDLTIDLATSEDYSSGSSQNRTELNVGVSKNIFNDRLKVSLGSNTEIEGPQSADQNSSNIAGNVTLDYQLSRDGRYMLRAYSKNENHGIAEGYLIETGLGFIFTLDYTVFKELFLSKSEKEIKKQSLEKGN